jgi:integrase
MNVKEAIILFRYYQQSHQRKRTIDSYQTLLSAFERIYGDRSLDSLQSDEIYQFLENSTTNSAKSTRRLRYAQLKAFFNFIIDKCHHDMKNPCDAPLLSKTFRMPRQVPRTILDKETVDEMIYNTKNPRDRLILELQARCGLRIGRITEHQGSGCVGEEADYKRAKVGERCRGCLHAGTDRKTTQIYLGKVSEHEAIRWMDILHGK